MSENLNALKQITENMEQSPEPLVPFGSMSDVVIIADSKGIIEFVTPSIYRVLGYDPKELLKQNVNMIVTDKDKERHLKAFAHYVSTRIPVFINTGQTIVVDARHKDGHDVKVYLCLHELYSQIETFHRYLYIAIFRPTSDKIVV